ncbi:hypothetical protein HD554DRAFT_1285920 [Boletus coccyginus]|nr:hypothetical protein HD554DRAFT_1285920 [Boletus coccyginus]
MTVTRSVRRAADLSTLHHVTTSALSGTPQRVAMVHKSSRPAPQVDQSRRFGPPLVQVEHTIDWNGSLDGLTPPISLPASSPRAQDTPSKRSGRTFALVPALANGRRVFAHVVVNPKVIDSEELSGSPLLSPPQVGLPEDMQDVLRQLDDLASWVKAASSSRDYIGSIVHATRLTGDPSADDGTHTTGNLSDGLFSNKGKTRLLSTSPPSECDIRRDLVVCTNPLAVPSKYPPNHQDSSRGAVPGGPTRIPPAIDCQSDGFIYVPDCNTPEFLVGCSSSPIAYPVCGYSSHPRYSPHPPETTHDIPYHRRFLERRSAPCSSSTSRLISPPSGKTSFKTFFQRSRCNTTAVSHSVIPSGHVPVENAMRQGKRMRLPWLRI